MTIRSALVEVRQNDQIKAMLGIGQSLEWGGSARVMVIYDNGDTEQLFGFYHDEISFTADEFIGLTKEEGLALFTKRDVAYLQS